MADFIQTNGREVYDNRGPDRICTAATSALAMQIAYALNNIAELAEARKAEWMPIDEEHLPKLHDVVWNRTAECPTIVDKSLMDYEWLMWKHNNRRYTHVLTIAAPQEEKKAHE
jgi:hypothetical protein